MQYQPGSRLESAGDQHGIDCAAIRVGVVLSSLLLVFAVAFAVALLLTAGLRRYADALGLLDRPGGHKQHATPVSAVGGLAVAIAVACGLLAGGWSAHSAFGKVLLAALAMLILGLIDDRRGLSARLRFAAQGLVALWMAAVVGVLLHDFGALFGGRQALQLGLWSWPWTVFAVVGVINACNMSDGLDGAAGTLVALALVGLLYLGGTQSPYSPLIVLVLGGLLGFLCWNAPLFGPARVYLGDAGSLSIGCVLAALLVSMSQGEARAFQPAAGLWLYALPLIDTVSVMWRRLAERRSPFQPDLRHFHHLLLRAGWSVRTAWLVQSTLAALGVIVAVAGTRLQLSSPLLAVGFVLIALLHHGLMRHADQYGRLFGRQLQSQISQVGD